MLYLGAKKSLLSSGKTLAQQVAAMFAGGEQGAWYEPSLTNGTLFQDAAGTTPVTDVGQPVGLMLDKWLGLVRGSELVGNGDFSSGAAGWALGNGWSIANGKAAANTTTGAEVMSRPYAGRVGVTYEVMADITMLATPSSTATVALNIGGGGENLFVTTQNSLLSGNSYRLYGLAKLTNATSFLLRVGSGSGLNYALNYAITNISVRELLGNHAIQPTTTRRPLFQSPPARIVYDGIDDALVTTFPASLGSSCTICRAIPGVGASILTGQTIGASYSDSTSHAGLIIINRALTAAETASVTAYLNAKAGV